MKYSIQRGKIADAESDIKKNWKLSASNTACGKRNRVNVGRKQLMSLT